MDGMIEAATGILLVSERRLEIASHNIANLSTSGFKQQNSFASVLSGMDVFSPHNTAPSGFTSFTQGELSVSENPLDLAITGTGFFKLRAGETYYYSRQGQFQRSMDGLVTTPQGLVLQQMSGGDLVLEGQDVEILSDGAVLENGLPIAHIGVFMVENTDAMRNVGGTLFTVNEDNMSREKKPALRQYMLENSNVTTADEMLGMMQAIRQAETGARLVQVYDTLIGQAITTFGQGR